MRTPKKNFTIFAMDDKGFTYLHHIECRRPKSTKAWKHVERMLYDSSTTTIEIGYLVDESN